MDIGHNKSTGEWSFDPEAMRAMILGKVTWRRCFACVEGKVWVDGEEGIVVSQSFVDEHGPDDIRFYRDCCEDCHGVGFVFVECQP